jgi:hypothetical protein
MGFLNNLVAETLGGISELIPGAPPPAAPPPIPSPGPTLPPHEPYSPPPSMMPPVDPSHLPESALDGIHGTNGTMPTVLPPGALGPYGTHEIAPGIWMPDDNHGDPDPAGSFSPGPYVPTAPSADTGLSGAAADRAREVDDALTKNRSAINDADRQLIDAVLLAQTTNHQVTQKLQNIQTDIIMAVYQLEPTLDTPTGQKALASFMQGKLTEIRGIIDNAQLTSQSQADIVAGVGAMYEAVQQPGG